MKHTAKVLALLLSLVLVLAGLASCDLFKEVEDKPTDTTTEEPGSDTKPSEKPTDPSTDEPGTDEPTPSDIVEIGTAEEFLAAAAKINAKTDGYETKTLKLTADIALSGDFTPISGFKGTLDGQFHKITGLDVAADTAAVGLFATLEGATVKNLIIEGAQAANGAPDSALGILAGTAKDAVVEAVTVSGTVTAGGKAIAGGLFGTAEATKILNVSVTVTVNGTGTKAGGVVGAMLDGATISAGYVDATVNVTGAVAGTVAGTKTNDSAVAFVLMKSGEAVGKVEGLEFLPSYIIACKTGLDAKADMGWSTVDWDVSGEVPALVKNTEKTHAVPKVTVDGTEVAAAWGEKIASGLSKPEDKDFVATVGYGLNGDVWYEGLPVLGDLALEKLTVDYSDLVLVGDPVDFTQPELIVLDTVTLGEEALTRVWAAEKKIGGYTTAVLYLSSASGKIYSISLEESTVAGLPAGALNFVLRNLTDNTSAEYCAILTMHCGAWEKDGEVLVFDGYATEKDGKNLYRVMNVTAGTVEYYTPYYVLKDGDLVLCLNGFAESDAGLEKDGAVWEVSVSYFDGEWVSTDGEKLVFADGKVNGFELKKEIHLLMGATLTYTDDKGVTYTLIATANGLTRASDAGSVTNFANNRFSGTYVSLVDGKLTTIRIEGNRVWVNGAADALTGILGVDGSVPTFTVKIGDVTYKFTQNGTQLCDANGVVYAAETDLAKFVGTWVLGSEKFVISNGSVTVGEKSFALTLSYANGAYSLTGGEMTFAFDGSNLTVAGYASPVTNDSSVRKLWTPAQANVFFGTFKHLYVAVNSSAKYEWHTIELKNGVLTIDGEVYAFEIATASYTGTMQVKVQYGTNWMGDPAVATLTPNGDLLTLGNLGMSMGYGAVPSTLQDVIGRYYQFLYGTGAEDETVGEIRLDVDGTLTVDGKTYNYGEYEMVVLGGKVIVTFTTAEGETQTVTFSNKTAVWSADAENTYMNYDRLLPDGNKYIVVGKDTDETLEVIKGNLGHTEIIPAEDEDEDDEEVWVDAVFPLYGFRYTVGGKTYTTTKFTWTRVSSSRATMILTLKAEDGAVTYIQVGYDPASDCSSVTIMSNGSTSEAHSSEQLGGFAGEYTDGKDKFSVDDEGVFKMNGDRVGYIPTFNFESGIYSFFVNGKTYTIDAARREIASADGEVFYDSRVFNYAGIKLIAFSVIGEGTYQRDYALELTPEGWKFAGELVSWQNYDGFRFNTEIGGETITWRPNSGTFESAVYSFCISLCPNATLNPELGESGWANRYFVPELLADNTGLYAGILGTGEMTDIFSIKAPVLDGNSFTSFTFTINSTEYLHSAFTMYMEDGALKLSFDDGDKVISLKTVEGGTELAINDVPAQDYVQPDMSGFATENQFAFGGTNANLDFIQIDVDENGKATWTYALGKGEYSQKTGENFGFGQWKGETIVFVQPNSYKGFAVVRMDGKVWVIYQEIFNLVLNPLTTPDGKTLTFDFVVEDGALKLVGEIDGVAITDIEQRDANYDLGGNNHAYIKYTFDGEDYAVALNADAETAKMHPAVVLTLDELNLCYHENLTTGSIYFAPIYDEETGAGAVLMVIKSYSSEYLPDSFEPTEEDASIYKLVYTIDGKTYTDYIKFFPGAAKEKGMKVIKGDFFPMLGEHKLGDETITVTFELDENGVPQYYLTIGGEKYLASVGTAKLTAIVGDYTYTLTVANGVVTAASVKTSWLVFDNSASYYAYSMADGTTGSAKVALEGGVFKVTFNSAAATNVALAEDESYLAFTGADGKNYRIYITNASSNYYKGVIVTEAQAAFLGNHESEKLEVALTQTSSWSAAKLEVKYDGSAVTNVVYQSGTLMSFEVGDKVYAAEVTADGVKVTKDVLDLGSEENKTLAAYIGSYTTDKSNKIVVGYTVTGTVGAYEAKLYVTFDGAEATLTVNTEKGNIVNITSGETVKHYALYASGSSKAFVEVSEDLYNSLGTTTIGDHTLTVSVKASYSSYSGYTLSTTYLVDGVEASSTSKTFGDLKFTQLQQKSGDKKYFYYYANGETVALVEMSNEDIAIANMYSKTVKVGDTTYTFKGNVTLADGAFAVGYVFGTDPEFTPVTLTAVEGVADAWSFTYGGATYYYLTSGTSYAYLVTAADYAVYGEKTYGDVTLKFTWGSSQLMVAVKGADGTFGTAVKIETLNDGTKDYRKFTADGKTYILAKDKDGNDVLTDATNIGSNLKHFKNFTYKGYSTPKVYDLNGNTVFDSVEAMYIIGDDGKPVFVFKFGDTIVSDYSEVANGEVIKAKIGDAYRYFAIATNYKPNSSWYAEDYQMVEVSEAQAAFFGTAVTVEEKGVFIVLGYSKKVAVFVGASADEKWSNTADNVTFNADGSLTFTYGGVNYKATVKDGALTVEVVTD